MYLIIYHTTVQPDRLRIFKTYAPSEFKAICLLMKSLDARHKKLKDIDGVYKVQFQIPDPQVKALICDSSSYE